MENSNLILARKAVINTYLKEGYDASSKVIKEIELGDYDQMFAIRAANEAIQLSLNLS